MKVCPKCAEEVLDQARVCKHCGHDFFWGGATGQILKVTIFATVTVVVVVFLMTAIWG